MRAFKAAVAATVVVIVSLASGFAVVTAIDPHDDVTPYYVAWCLATVAVALIAGRRVAGPPALRAGIVKIVVAAPFAVIALMAVLIAILEVLGADCPRGGMDYIDECNGLAGAQMMVFFLGIYVVAILAAAALVVGLAAIGKRAAPATLRRRWPTS